MVAVNSFGVGGANVHILLKPHVDEKNRILVKTLLTDIPRIVPLFGRSKDCLDNQEKYFRKNFNKVDGDFLSLFYNVCSTSKMNFRGYLIKEEKVLRTNANSYYEQKRKKIICFVFPGKVII